MLNKDPQEPIGSDAEADADGVRVGHGWRSQQHEGQR